MTSQRQMTFRFKPLPWILLWLAAVELFGVVVGAIWMHRQGTFGALAFSIIWCFGLGLIGGVAVRGLLDIIVDEDGISRKLFGMTWQCFRWDGIERIVIRRVVDPSSNRGKTARAFAIYSKKTSNHSTWPMSFIEKGERISDLVDLMNSYISKFNIKIESEEGSEAKYVSHL